MPATAVSDRLRRVDPEGRAWRNAVRGVVCTVPLFAAYAALGATTWAPWAFIGVLNTLFPDVGGPRGPRLRTGVEILVGSAAATFLGALVADSAPVLVVTMFLVAFAAAYVGVCSPYLAAAGTSVLLVFLLSAGTPAAGLGDAGWRVLHVSIGALVATVALVGLLPAPRRRHIEPALAAACRAVADLLDPPGAGADAAASHDGSEEHGAYDDAERRARAAVAAMVESVTTQRWPPLSGSAVDRARLAFAHDLQSLSSRALAIHRADRLAVASGVADAERAVASGVADAERAVAALALRDLAGWLVDEGAGPDGTAARAASEQAARIELDARAEALGRVGDVAALDRFRTARRVAAACRLVALLVDGARSTAFHTEQPGPVAPAGLPDVTGGLASYRDRLVHNLSAASMIFRHALRLGTACAVAVTVERALDLPHGYWAVLTVVVTLRTNLGASARRSFDRLLGTVAGLAVAATTIAVAEASGARVLVIESMTVVMLAATLWTSATRLRWTWAVTSVTACVLTMFQLLQPGDWALEADRLLATVLGLAIALTTAVVLWPGGTVDALRRSLAAATGAGADLLALVGAAAHGPVGTGPGAAPGQELARARATVRRRLSQARTTLGAACRDGVLGVDSPLTTAVLQLEQAAELVHRVDDGLTGSFRTPPGPGATALLDRSTTAAADHLREAAAALEPAPPPHGAGTERHDLPERGRDDPARSAWAALAPADPVPPQVLDAVADLSTLGHRTDDLLALAHQASERGAGAAGDARAGAGATTRG